MQFFDKYKIKYYKQPKHVELKFLEPFDVIEQTDVGDYDRTANVVILGFNIKNHGAQNVLIKQVVMPNGDITELYSYYYDEPTFKVVGKAVEKSKTDELVELLTK